MIIPYLQWSVGSEEVFYKIVFFKLHFYSFSVHFIFRRHLSFLRDNVILNAHSSEAKVVVMTQKPSYRHLTGICRFSINDYSFCPWFLFYNTANKFPAIWLAQRRYMWHRIYRACIYSTIYTPLYFAIITGYLISRPS